MEICKVGKNVYELVLSDSKCPDHLSHAGCYGCAAYNKKTGEIKKLCEKLSMECVSPDSLNKVWKLKKIE